jgi:hypothetical protein
VISSNVADADLRQLVAPADAPPIGFAWPFNEAVETTEDHFVTTFVFSVRLAGVSGGALKMLSWKAVQPLSLAASRTYEDDVRAQVSRLWAEDWDCEEDAVYDGDEW